MKRAPHTGSPRVAAVGPEGGVNSRAEGKMRILLAALTLMAFAVSCTATEGPSVRFDCPNCPVLVMGDHDSPEWQRLDTSTEFIEDIMVLLGCHYGYQTDDTNPKVGIRDKGDGPLLGNDEHLALIFPIGNIEPEPGVCYEMMARPVAKMGERPPPAPSSVHYFVVVEFKPLTDEDWQRWAERK